MVDLNKEKLKLDYPCSWVYKIVLLQEDNAKKIVKEVLEGRTHTLKASKTSKKGKFASFNLDLIVHNDDDRKYLYEILGKHDQIKMVL